MRRTPKGLRLMFKHEFNLFWTESGQQNLENAISAFQGEDCNKCA